MTDKQPDVHAEDADRIEIALECLKEHFDISADKRRLGTADEIRELLKYGGRLQVERQQALEKVSCVHWADLLVEVRNLN